MFGDSELNGDDGEKPKTLPKRKSFLSQTLWTQNVPSELGNQGEVETEKYPEEEEADPNFPHEGHPNAEIGGSL